MDINGMISDNQAYNSSIDLLNRQAEQHYDDLKQGAEAAETTKEQFQEDKIGAAGAETLGNIKQVGAKIVANRQAGQAAKAGEEGIELDDLSSGARTGTKAFKAATAGVEAGTEAVEGLSATAKIASGLGKVASAAGTAGAVVGVAQGGYDVVNDIINDVKTGHITLGGPNSNTEEKVSDVGQMVGGGLDALGLATGQPEILLAGAVVGGISDIISFFGHKKAHEEVPPPAKPPVVENVALPNFGQMGMVQNHVNNISAMVN
jgi:hypothetical protein